MSRILALTFDFVRFHVDPPMESSRGFASPSPRRSQACSSPKVVRPTRSAVAVATLVYLPFPILRAFFILPGIAWFAFIGLAVPAALIEVSAASAPTTADGPTVSIPASTAEGPGATLTGSPAAIAARTSL